MTYPTWPSDLPNPGSVDNYASGPADARIVTPMEKGAPKVRRRGRAPRPVTCAFIAETPNDLARFERFWEEQTSGGVSPFYLPDVFWDGLPILDEDGVQLLDEDDIPLIASVTNLAMFDESEPQYQVLAGGPTQTRVTFGILVLP